MNITVTIALEEVVSNENNYAEDGNPRSWTSTRIQEHLIDVQSFEMILAARFQVRRISGMVAGTGNLVDVEMLRIWY